MTCTVLKPNEVSDQLFFSHAQWKHRAGGQEKYFIRSISKEIDDYIILNYPLVKFIILPNICVVHIFMLIRVSGH